MNMRSHIAAPLIVLSVAAASVVAGARHDTETARQYLASN